MSSLSLVDQTPLPDDNNDVVYDFHPRFRVYKNGQVERFRKFEIILPSEDPAANNGVLSRDVVVSPETGVSVRIFFPNTIDHSCSRSGKLPLLVYIHGGAFCLQSAFSETFHNYVSSLVSKANVLAVSVDYRLAPEHPIPACYDDTWAVIQWIESHKTGTGPDPWINNHADFTRIFFAGDSAGANIAHNMLTRLGSENKILGAALIQPFFGNGKPDDHWAFICPDSTGPYDPRLNPAAHPEENLAKLGCAKVLVCVAGDDGLKDRGMCYYEGLKKSGWIGEVEIFETEGEDHVFHLFHPESDQAAALLEKVASFLSEAYKTT